MRSRLATALALAAFAAGAVACGGDDDGGGGSGAASTSACPSDAVVIKMVDIKFDPEKATAKAGQEICWPNEDEVEHDVSAESGADFKSDLYGKGETFTTKVDKAGTVEYLCTVHPGMTGSIDVTGGGG